jgi:hypothetical protein
MKTLLNEFTPLMESFGTLAPSGGSLGTFSFWNFTT